jgi:hypothetical protein
MPLIILFGSCELEYLVNHISADTLTTARTNNPSADRLGLGLWCLMPLIWLTKYSNSQLPNNIIKGIGNLTQFFWLILFRPFGLVAPKHFKIIWLQNL